MWTLAASNNTLPAAAVILALIGIVPGTLAYRASRKDTQTRASLDEGANLVTGFDSFSRALAADNKDLRARVRELEAENTRLRQGEHR